jgi:hypothetical protein
MYTTKTIDAGANISEMRREYAERRAHASYDNSSRSEFDAAVRKLVRGEATPEQWLKAADAVRFVCRRCAGTGSFVTGTVNGKPTGPGGSCFRCDGRGVQGWLDGRRNAYHDGQAFARAAWAMMHDAA